MIIPDSKEVRLMLPDGRHEFRASFYDSSVRVSVYDTFTRDERLSTYINKKLENWVDLYETALELARKRFKSQSVRHAPDIMKRWSR